MRVLSLVFLFFPTIVPLTPLARWAAAGAQEPEPAAGAAEERVANEPRLEEQPPVVTHHQIQIGDRVLRYQAATGMLPIRTDQGEPEGHIFYIAYTLEGAPDVSRRPLTFSFNGGPGSSSVWLHLGALGPKRVAMLEDGSMPAPPYRLVPNEHTWLPFTDMVFIDPVGTGYSRPAAPEKGGRFWSLEGDISSVGEFIRLYLARNQRWSSPLFLIGESYGTTRAAGLSGHLVERSGIGLNGVILVSSVLNFQTIGFAKGNDLPYLVYLPTYTATAWYHRKLPAELQEDLRRTLDEVEDWALHSYAVILAKGDRLAPEERAEAVETLARYTGLSPEFVDRANLRIEPSRFRKELLRGERRTLGRLDSRFVGLDPDDAGEQPDFDPSMAAIRPPYTAALNDYVRRELGYDADRHYWILGGGIGRWDFEGGGRSGFADTSDALRSAMAKNPYMKVLVASGYYDLATPYWATEYTLSHLDLAPALRQNIEVEEYEAGHMMYIHEESLAELTRDAARFYENALAAAEPGVGNVTNGR